MMVATPSKEFLSFLSPYPKKVQELALSIRTLILETTPTVYELIWDNYNAVAVAYSTSEQLKDAYCHFAVYSKHVNLGFNRGVELIDKKKVLKGRGKLIRHISIHDLEDFDKDYYQKLIMAARIISEERNPKKLPRDFTFKSIVKSISAKKIRPM